jgi:calcium-dependent protein kinase
VIIPPARCLDFGLAKEYLDPKYVMTERVGTVYTMGPDVLLGAYSYPADLWSLGVVTYMLLSGTKPFWSHKKKRIVEKILRSRVQLNGPEWRFISKEAKEFVSLLLQKDPDKRLTAEEAQAHDWLRNEYKLSNRRPDEEVMNKVGEALVNYADSGEFKKVALNVIAHKSTAEQIFQIRAAFDQYDTNNDGRISIEGFKAALAKFNYSEEELGRMFASVDVNQDGDSIYFTEFLAATLETQGRIEEHRLAEAFDRFDEDDSGYISRKNLKNILGKNCTEAYLDKLMAEADRNNDGQIEYEEFLALFMNQKRSEIQEIYDADDRFCTTNHYDNDVDAYDAIDVDK